MKSKLNLMTALVGLAMLATPLTAAAKDHKRFDNSHAARFARSFNAPRYVAPAVVTSHQFRKHQNATWMSGLAPNGRHEWREHHDGNDGDADDYQNYGNSGYYPAPVYAAPVYAAPVYSGYGSGYGGGQNCNAAQRIMNAYYRDRNTGHPAAAASLLRQNQWAMRSGCVTNAPIGGGRGLLGGLGGLGGYGGAPAYANYGGYNGNYNGGYNNGYNGGYGQPYGGNSILTPLLQQFVR